MSTGRSTPTGVTDEAGHDLYRWTDKDGVQWACMQYDHSAFCRLCHPITDPTEALIWENVDSGYMEPVKHDNKGEFHFRLTPTGQQRADQLLGR